MGKRSHPSIKIQAAVDGNFWVGNHQNVRSSLQGLSKGIHQGINLKLAQAVYLVVEPQPEKYARCGEPSSRFYGWTAWKHPWGPTKVTIEDANMAVLSWLTNINKLHLIGQSQQTNAKANYHGIHVTPN
jgi:hypothetical protein